MKILVCIKPVRTELLFPNESRKERFYMNPYDLYALENCLAFKQTLTDCGVSVLSMGPAASEDVLIQALAMGADAAYLLCDSKFAGSDTVATTYVLSRVIKKVGTFDLIVCGKKSIDGETGQVVFGLSERLRVPCVPDIESLSTAENGLITATQTLEDCRRTIRLKVPALISFSTFRTSYLPITLVALKKAKKKGVYHLNADDLAIAGEHCGLQGSKTKVVTIKSDLIKKDSVLFEGSAEKKAAEVLALVCKTRV